MNEFMPRLVSERIKKLREGRFDLRLSPIADVSGLQEILDELMTLNDWKKPDLSFRRTLLCLLRK